MNKIYRIIELETDNSHVELRKKSMEQSINGPRSKHRKLIHSFRRRWGWLLMRCELTECFANMTFSSCDRWLNKL